MRVVDRRRFYFDERGGNVWDHLDPVEKANTILWEETFSEVFTKLLSGFNALTKEKLEETKL